MKKTILILSALAFICSNSYSQLRGVCDADQVRAQAIKNHPEILQFEADLENQVREKMQKIDLKHAAKTTSEDTSWIDVPVVVHIIHDYGAEDLTDAQIITAVANWNIVYAGANTDTNQVIQPFKKYIGNPRIRIHLATKDPFGNPCHGITRRRSYLTYHGGENAKYDDWAASSYLNIWSVQNFSFAHNGAAAYAQYPAVGAAEPFYDGAISIYNYMGYDGDKVLNHEMSHCFNLKHTFGDANAAGVGQPCSDDGVDDTPPTHGDQNNCPLYDSDCATGYLKIYASAIPGVDSLVDYPDTANVQNIMNYSTCTRMFTKGQVKRMQDCFGSPIDNRNNLVDSANLTLTGALQWPDVAITPDFSVSKVFVCPGTITSDVVKFVNHSWNDTATQVNWSFSNGPIVQAPSTLTNTPPLATPNQFFTNPTSAYTNVSFSTPGWVTVTMAVAGNHTGTSTLVDNQRVFVADTNATNANGYLEEFNSGGDLGNYPMFNIYNNEFKWQLSNVGYYDNTGIMYTGYDSRIDYTQNMYPLTGIPGGDSDDFYTPVFDLSTLSGGTQACMNFMYSGTTRTNISQDMNDVLTIAYMMDCGSWVNLATLKKASLDNKGTVSTYYVPTSTSDWSLKNIPLPAALTAPGHKVAFRFRYGPGMDGKGYNTANYEGHSTGNNFYLDRLSFSSSPATAVNTLLPNQDFAIAISPNPTNGDAYIAIKDLSNTAIRIRVTDISGRLVYATEKTATDHVTDIIVPKSALSASGIYIVNVSTPNQVHTEKLVVY